MTGIRPTALGYVSGSSTQALDRQRDVVTDHAAAEGLAVERIVTDWRDGLTISQLVGEARACGARVVLIPAGVRMAEVQVRVTRDLEPDGAVCVVIGQTGPRARRRAGRLASDPPHRRQAVPA